jgi:hypothetical protein
MKKENLVASINSLYVKAISSYDSSVDLDLVLSSTTNMSCYTAYGIKPFCRRELYLYQKKAYTAYLASNKQEYMRNVSLLRKHLLKVLVNANENL